MRLQARGNPVNTHMSTNIAASHTSARPSTRLEGAGRDRLLFDTGEQNAEGVAKNAPFSRPYVRQPVGGIRRQQLDSIRCDLAPYTLSTSDKNATSIFAGDATSPKSSSNDRALDDKRIMLNTLTEIFGYDSESAITALQLVDYRSVAEAVNILMHITSAILSTGDEEPSPSESESKSDARQDDNNGSEDEFPAWKEPDTDIASYSSCSDGDLNGAYTTLESMHFKDGYPTSMVEGLGSQPKKPHENLWDAQACAGPRRDPEQKQGEQLRYRRSPAPEQKTVWKMGTEPINSLPVNTATYRPSEYGEGHITTSKPVVVGRRTLIVETTSNTDNDERPRIGIGTSSGVVLPGSLRWAEATANDRVSSRRHETIGRQFIHEADDSNTFGPQSSSDARRWMQREPTNRRSLSPLSQAVAHQLERGTYRGSTRPCKVSMFRFFVEQHIEKLIHQRDERRQRETQLIKEMEAAGFARPAKEQMLRLLRQKESRYMRLRRQKMDRTMFELIRKIGVGAFGKVSLVKKKDTAQVYAMKTLSKEDVIQKQQLAHVKAERDILAEANSNWIVKLFFSFQDAHNLYFIMEYVPGGDMMHLLIEKGIFGERLARFYIAELTCALEYVHGLGFIHRDIKPDNILIDRNGHIKLTDFGLCTGLRWTHDKRHYTIHGEGDPTITSRSRADSFFLPPQNGGAKKSLLEYRNPQRKRNEAHSVVGTGNYMAPEVITKIGHTQMCDWWSVGVIAYEMVYGRPPFLSLNESQSETQYMIVNWRHYLDLNSSMGARLSRNCKEFIARLCCDQHSRLGCSEGAVEIKRHPWFKGIDFANLRQTRAEYVPRVEHDEDTSNFDHCGMNSEDLLKEVRGRTRGTEKDGSQAYNPAFLDFTFRHFFSFDGDAKPIPLNRK